MCLWWCHITLTFHISRSLVLMYTSDVALTSTRLYGLVSVGKDFTYECVQGHWLGGVWQLLLHGGRSGIVSVLVHHLRSACAKITGVLSSHCGK